MAHFFKQIPAEESSHFQLVEIWQQAQAEG
jgi:hypothetical protein